MLGHHYLAHSNTNDVQVYCPDSLSALLSLQTSQPANVELQWFVVGIVDSAIVSHSITPLGLGMRQ